ncbi:MAG: SipW-dependent-type signal peptide-containing protein [bacterium]|nr:SipW-dependent-type signal peptide-containing protein [bacterium]
MRRIILGLITIIGAGAVIVSGATGAFFSDTETSVGNTFAAGTIDLKVDNKSYYNGVANSNLTWQLDDLPGHLFFNFLDLKPDDEGEDTISLHVENDAWACMDVTLTSNNDVSSNEPELGSGDTQDDLNNNWDGELAQNIQMFWWADDGDNVLEDDETANGQGISGGIQTLMNLASTTGAFSVALADSDDNVWGTPGPMPANTEAYIAKAWCFGALTLSPLAIGTGVNPSANSGILCDGANLNNETQTDGATLDVQFEAIQSRHNPDFQCEECTFDILVDLLIDGRFETPEVPGSGQWDVFASVAGGWTVEWRGDIPASFGLQTRPVIANLELHEGVLGAAFEGDQYAELDTDWGGPSDSGNGEPASVSIYRNFATVPGANYTLKYHFSPRPNTVAADNNLEVKVEGTSLDTTGPTAGGGAISWSERTVNFIAGDASTEIRFTDLGTANSLGTFLDNVRLYQTSCPSRIL